MIEKHKNPDGTYNGVGVLSDMTGMSRQSVVELWQAVKANGAKLDACPYHEFVPSEQKSNMRGAQQRYVCVHCGGEIGTSDYHWHEQGRKPKP